MAKEHEEGSPEKGFLADDYFLFGMSIGRHLGSCSDFEYWRNWGELLLDLAAGMLTLTDSAADFRVWRDSWLAELKDPEVQERLGIDPAEEERILNRIDPEEETRFKIMRDRRLARDVLESCWGEEVIEQWIQAKQARN